MNVKVTYTGSSGNTYDLKLKERLRLKKANFHKYAWTMDTTKQKYGVTVDEFRRDPIWYDASLIFTGTYEENKEMLEALHADFERDILTNQEGKLTWGDYSIGMFVTSSSTYPNDKEETQNDITIYCPYPFWTMEKTIHIFPYTPTVTDEDKQYSYQYPYSYASSQDRTVYFDTAHYAESDFRMVAYGPFSELSVEINDDLKRIGYAVSSGEFMVVDSRQHGQYKGEAYVIKSDGTKVNVFDYRAPEHQLFKKVPAGKLDIDYSRTHGIDLTVFLERSEPIWTLS